jgi:predicted alpha/beta-hydrolase family hydrolase
MHFRVDAFSEGSVRGFLHRPGDANAAGSGLALTHGAGGNCNAPLLIAIADTFCAAGWCVLRCDLPFRQRKRFGPPSPATAAQDREGLRDAVSALRKLTSGPVILGGHSYGGRQATMLAAETPGITNALLLLSYPLHPPGKPEQMRAGHFPALRTPALFVHGTKDPFGSIEEMRNALQSITARNEIAVVEGAGHDLMRGKFDLSELVLAPLRSLL